MHEGDGSKGPKSITTTIISESASIIILCAMVYLLLVSLITMLTIIAIRLVYGEMKE